MSYNLCKHRIVMVMGEDSHYLTSLTAYSNETVLDLDNQLDEAYRAIPSFLKLHSQEETRSVSISLQDKSVQLEFLYHQGKCILHRKYFAIGRLNDRYACSRLKCIESALALLSLQWRLYVDAKAKGSTITGRWYRVSYSAYDFILAAVIIVLEIRHRTTEVTTGIVGSWANDMQQKNIFDTLLIARTVWEDARNYYPEAEKVYKILANMLESLGVSESTPSDPLQSIPLESIPGRGQLEVGEQDTTMLGTDFEY